MRTLVRSLMGSLAAAAVFSAPAGAQSADARWQPWLGCWSAESAAPRNLDGSPSAKNEVCVGPAATGSGVEIFTIVDGKTVQTDTLDVAGGKVSKTRDGCTGWEQASWSRNARRVFLRSEFTCPGGTVRRSSGLLGISPAGEFLQVHGMTVADRSSIRVAAFSPQQSDSTGFARQTTRLAASAPISLDDVLEVAKSVDTPVAEAWLTDVGQPFKLDANSLVKLSDAGMQPRVIDLMVALSNPKMFVVRKTPDGMVGGVDAQPQTRVASNNRGRMPISSIGYMPIDFPMWGMGWGMLSYFDMMRLGLYGNSYYRNGFYGNAFFGNGFYGNGLWGNPYYGFGGYYSGVTPVVIAPRAEPPQGRAVNGAGYTRPYDGGSSRTTSPSGRADSRSGYSSGGSSGGSSSSSSGASSSGSAGASSGGSGRTAQPRPPGN